MSSKGVKSVAAILRDMQQVRIKLIAGDSQDRALSAVLRDGNDAMTKGFCRATSDPKISELAAKDKRKRDQYWKKLNKDYP